MNWNKINQLLGWIDSLKKRIEENNEAIGNMQKILPKAGALQGELDHAVISAQRRVSALQSFGFSEAFLEDLFNPVKNRPQVDGISAAISGGISKAESDSQQAKNKIGTYSREIERLKSEDLAE